jgi:hypothetical protein
MVQTMRSSSVRLALCAALMLAASACASVSRDDALLAAAAKLPRFPACENEIRAFVALTRLARQLGDNWRVYEPALEALQDQVMECVEESYPNPVAI